MRHCKAPCVINASGGFQIVFCNDKFGHEGDHSFMTNKNKSFRGFRCTNDVIITWSYLGHTAECDNYAPPMNKRCQNWCRPTQAELLSPDSFEWYAVSHAKTTPSTIGFCCEKQPEHEEKGHLRSGIFGPLGVKWKIEW